MTQRLRVIAVAGLLTVLAAGGLSFSLRDRGSLPSTDIAAHWGIFSDAQWGLLQRRLGPIRIVTAMPPLAILRVRGGCLVVLRTTTTVGRICGQAPALRVFAVRRAGQTDIVGVVEERAEAVVATMPDGNSMGTGLNPAPHRHVFGIGFPSRGPFVLTARGAGGSVLARVRVYCASALRGVCGISEQRRS